MKIAFYIFAATCLISALTAADLSAFDKNNDLVNSESNFLNFAVPDDDGLKEQSQNLIFPPSRSFIIWSTYPPTTSTPYTTGTPSSSTPSPTYPTPSTTTSSSTTPQPTTTPRPRPSPPPPRPTTTLPPPPLKNPQIYNNRVENLGPFAGRLFNIVVNKGGRQGIFQQNQILYNIKSTGAKLLEEKSNE